MPDAGSAASEVVAPGAGTGASSPFTMQSDLPKIGVNPIAISHSLPKRRYNSGMQNFGANQKVLELSLSDCCRNAAVIVGKGDLASRVNLAADLLDSLSDLSTAPGILRRAAFIVDSLRDKSEGLWSLASDLRWMADIIEKDPVLSDHLG